MPIVLEDSCQTLEPSFVNECQQQPNCLHI